MEGLSATLSRREVASEMNKRKLEAFEHILGVIGADFDQRVLDDPTFASAMPANAYVLFQLKIEGVSDPRVLGEIEEFNTWLKDMSERQREPRQPIYKAVLTVRYKPVEPQPDWRLLDRYPRDFRLAPLRRRT